MRTLKKNIFSVGAIDFDARLFDRLVPLPDGTSYNSFLIKGTEKTALIDTVDPSKTETLIDNIVRSGVEKIDYIVSNHAEQDHSGSLGDMLMLYPDAKIVTIAKCKEMLMDLLDIEEKKFQVVEDGQTLSLGDKTLEFIFLPWVHWPETIGTYIREDRILFSCDFFGSHYATTSQFVEDKCTIYEAAKCYYAEIMMPFKTIIKKNIEKLEKYELQIIAPSHGPAYDEPEFIIDAYKDWISDKVENLVVIPYVSMHGSTAKMVDYLVAALMERGINVKQLELTTVDVGKLAISLVDAATLVLGTPTILAGAHPAAVYAVFLANALRPKTRFASVIGSYGWGGKTVEQVSSLMANVKAEIIEPVLAKGTPREEDFMKLEKLADEIHARHKEISIVD